MKSIQERGMLFKLLTFFGLSSFAIAPIAFVIFMGWASIEFNAAVIVATISLCLFLLTSIFIPLDLSFDFDITSQKTDKKINQFFSKIVPYVKATSFIFLVFSLCYFVYFYFQLQIK